MACAGERGGRGGGKREIFYPSIPIVHFPPAQDLNGKGEQYGFAVIRKEKRRRKKPRKQHRISSKRKQKYKPSKKGRGKVPFPAWERGRKKERDRWDSEQVTQGGERGKDRKCLYAETNSAKCPIQECSYHVSWGGIAPKTIISGGREASHSRQSHKRYSQLRREKPTPS